MQTAVKTGGRSAYGVGHIEPCLTMNTEASQIESIH